MARKIMVEVTPQEYEKIISGRLSRDDLRDTETTNLVEILLERMGIGNREPHSNDLIFTKKVSGKEYTYEVAIRVCNK